MRLSDAFSALRGVVARSDVITKFFGALLSNLKAFSISQEISAIIVLARRNSVNLCKVSKALRTAFLFVKHHNFCFWFR